MSNITVAETLKMHGKWIEAKPFASLVSEKLKISERMAYIKIKEATKHNEILRIPLPNRTVLYGLAEFGPLPSIEKKSSTGSAEIGSETAKTLIHYRILEKEYGSKAAGSIADILEDILEKYGRRKGNPPKRDEHAPKRD
jgi:hypothetical protein